MKAIREVRLREKQEGIEHTQEVEDIRDDIDKQNEDWIKKSKEKYDKRQKEEMEEAKLKAKE